MLCGVSCLPMCRTLVVVQLKLGDKAMAPQYEFSDQVLMVLYIGMAIVIPGIVMLFDDAKMHTRS